MKTPFVSKLIVVEKQPVESGRAAHGIMCSGQAYQHYDGSTIETTGRRKFPNSSRHPDGGAPSAAPGVIRIDIRNKEYR
jgi:hypothetical protein